MRFQNESAATKNIIDKFLNLFLNLCFQRFLLLLKTTIFQLSSNFSSSKNDNFQFCCMKVRSSSHQKLSLEHQKALKNLDHLWNSERPKIETLSMHNFVQSYRNQLIKTYLPLNVSSQCQTSEPDLQKCWNRNKSWVKDRRSYQKLTLYCVWSKKNVFSKFRFRDICFTLSRLQTNGIETEFQEKGIEFF